MIKISKINEVYFLVEGVNPGDEIELQELALEFQFTHPKSRFSKSFQMGDWDGEVRFMKFLNYYKEQALLPTGLLYDALQICKRRKIKVKIDDFGIRKLDYLDRFDDYFSQVIQPTLPSTIKIREYQLEAVKHALNVQKSTMISPTGSGKSFIIYLFIRWVLDHDFKKGEKFLLVVPNVSLVDQMADDFISYGYSKPNKISRIYYGKEKNFNNSIIISTWQSIHKKNYEWFDQFSGLIIDETHRAKSDRVQFVTENCVNARFRLGTTGTLQSDLLEKYQVIGNLGYPFKTKSTIELVEDGHLSPFIVKNTVLKWKSKEKFSFTSFDEEFTEIITNENRQKLMVNFINDVYTKNKIGTFLVLASRVDYLNTLYDRLKEIHENVYLIYGDIKPDKRQKILNEIKENGGILVANIQIMGTGVNIPNVSNIVIATPFKSADILAIQTIGRAIRLHPSKSIANIYDFFDKIPVKKRKHNNVFTWLNEKCLVYKKEGYHFENYQYEFNARERNL